MKSKKQIIWDDKNFINYLNKYEENFTMLSVEGYTYNKMIIC